MTQFTNPLDQIKIAAPCTADWNQMIGNEQVRFCGQCSLNVYNLSGMSKKEAESLILRNEGRLCVRFYQRADGSILTDNCPVGLKALKKQVARVASAVAGMVLGFLGGFSAYLGFGENQKPIVMGEMTPVVRPVQPERVTMGQMVAPPPPSRSLPVMGKLKMGEVALSPKKTACDLKPSSGRNSDPTPSDLNEAK